MNKAFNNPRHNILHLQFPNGNRISTIWGYGSYTENYNLSLDALANPSDIIGKFLDSNTVEIMVDCSDKLFKKLQKRFDTTNTVFGHLTIEQWLRVVNDVAKEVK